MGALEYLKEREWSMGNGQCPDCCGCPADWLGHPLYLTGEKLGHKKDCKIAIALVELGEKPLFKGGCEATEEYESYITDSGFFSTRLKTPEGCPKIKKMNEEFRQSFTNTLMEHLES